MSIKTYNVKLNGKVYEVEIEEVKAGQQPTMSATPQAAPASAPTGSGQAVEAPLQGSMFNILVKQGQSVKKGDVFTIVETQNGWGKLKSGAGWISLGYTEKLK